MSSIRSASSSTRNCSALKSAWRCPIKSSSRPGVAMTTSTPERNASICGRSPTPPKTFAMRNGTMFAVGDHILLDLHDEFASRREDRARAFCARPGCGGACAISVSIGSVKAAVFPVPVCAMPMRSCPARTSGTAADWMGVGSV